MSRRTRGARQALATLPLAVRTTMGLAQASVAALRALVVVTALMPVFALLCATLAVREAAERARGGR
jgi:hypothetical protein